MKSPFPGLDPYLEMRWRDVHSRLMVYASDQLNEQLPPLIDECYRRGRHEKTNYADEPIPRLSREDTQWADRLLREKGFR